MSEQKLKFLNIKEHRPPEGKHLFVWDNVDKKAHPVIYKGSHETWETLKDKEKRFTHFVELDPPPEDPPQSA